MAECMAFPKTADEFIGQYKFTDTKQEYTNGAELIPVFRVKQMMEHYFAKDNNVPSKWIPVTERLPEYETEVLTYRKSGVSVEVRWRTYWDNDEFSDYPVTHWMPLPHPPKEEL